MDQQKLPLPEPEQKNFEYKTCSIGKLPKDLWETISAFSNTDGGVIFLGVAPDGTVTGIEKEFQDQLQSEVATLTNDYFNYPVFVDIQVRKDQSIAIHVPPASVDRRPIFVKSKGEISGGRIRVGSSNIPLSSDHLRRFALAAQGGVEMMYLPELDAQRIIDIEQFNDWVNRINKARNDVYIDIEINTLLKKLRIINNSNQLSFFGLLGMSKQVELQENYPLFIVTVTQYRGSLKVDTNNPNDVSADKKEFRGNVIQQFRESYAFLLSRLPIKSQILEKGIRQDFLIVPEVTIRELLANALVHRDYSINSGQVFIDIYTDRIEFCSPGKSLVPIDQLDKAPSVSRNPFLMVLMKDMGITEGLARGIVTVKETLKKAGLTEPTFQHRGDSFVATIYTSTFINNDDQSWLSALPFTLKPTQGNALVYLRHNSDGISNRTYRDINNMTKVKDDLKAKKELAKLVRDGLLITVGDKRYRKYLLSSKYA